MRDDGDGIHPDFHERIFGIFQTLKSRDELEASGIGLAVVKKILERRGGSIALESEEGSGATFQVSWPNTPRRMTYDDDARDSH